MKVSLFTTCLVDFLASGVGIATVELLENLGCKIDYPKGQTCCGQPAFNSGYVTDAKKSFKHMIETFEHATHVVSPSGSCITMLKEYPHHFDDEPEWKVRAQNLADKSYELTQFIVDVLKIEKFGAKLMGKGVYHKSCHMTRILGVRDAPLTLLKNVTGLEIINLPFDDQCCGFGGTFSVKMSDISVAMVDEKVKHIESVKPDYLIGADYACLMNIGGRLSRKGSHIKVMHIAEVLNSVVKEADKIRILFS